MEKLRESPSTPPGHHSYLYNPQRDYITRNKESAKDPSAQSFGDGEAINHPENMDYMTTSQDTVAYLVASTIDGGSAGQPSHPQEHKMNNHHHLVRGTF